MPLPYPHPGLVVCYSYLWHNEYMEGKYEGLKNRPCVVVLGRNEEDGQVIVAPVTHTQPQNLSEAIEIPYKTKERLGLDSERSWIILNEVNKFLWPGVDLRPVSRQLTKKYDYGVLPPRFFNRVKIKFLSLAREKRLNKIQRSV